MGKDQRSFREAHPILASQWHPTMNRGLTADEVPASYAGRVWWICDQSHQWAIRANRRTQYDSGCPVCANKQVRPGVNDLETLDPELAAEWHPTANGVVTPDVVAPGYKTDVMWRPPNCGHEFSRAPILRRSDRRCPVCLDTRVYPGQNDFATVYPELVPELGRV